MTRKFSSISVETTLASSLSNSATSMTVATGTGTALMGGVSLAAGNIDQFMVALDPDTINEELVAVTGVSGDVLTIRRGQGGTSAITHSGGALVRHVVSGDDMTAFEANASLAVVNFNQQGSNYTLVSADATKVVEMNSASANTLTIPTNAAVAFPIGTQVLISQIGAGQTTIAGAVGVTVQSNGSRLKLAGQFAQAMLIKRDTNTWILSGNLVA